MATIGKRLREERERLKLTQVQMGAYGGVRKQTQLKYEQDESSPSGEYLAAVANIGVDVQYVVVGQRSQLQLTSDEVAIAIKSRGLTKIQKQAVLQVINELTALN